MASIGGCERKVQLIALYPRTKMKPSMIAKAAPMMTADDLIMKKAML